MKKLFIILIFFLNFQLLAKAENILDFEIEGMTIGDSLLDYVTLSDIKIFDKKPSYYKDKKFITIFVDINLKQYESLQVVYKPNDKRFIIHEIKGIIEFQDNIKECKNLKKKVSKELDYLFANAQKISEIRPHEYDKSKNSITDSLWIYPIKGGYVHVACNDWGTEMYEEHRWTDNFEVTIGSEEFKLFLMNEAYN